VSFRTFSGKVFPTPVEFKPNGKTFFSNRFVLIESHRGGLMLMNHEVVNPLQVIHPSSDRAKQNYVEAFKKIRNIFFIINFREVHWILLRMDIIAKRWRVYDTLIREGCTNYWKEIITVQVYFGLCIDTG
jgi:hypothetical protein